MLKNVFSCIFIAFILFTSYCYAQKKPDPLYLNSDVIDMESVEKAKQLKQEKKAKKKKKKKPKKLKQWQIDKNNQPVTMEDYLEQSKEKLRTEYEIPEPKFEKDSEFIFPETMYRAISYNNPPGQRNIDVTKIIQERVVTSPAILSPDKTKMIYTKVMYYPQYNQTASSVYLIKLKDGFKDAYDILYKANVVQGSTLPIFTTGMKELTRNKFSTLFPLDFSKDSSKIALKEKIGSNYDKTWNTNIIIYDFDKNKVKRLDGIRTIVESYWKNNKQIELNDYLWDIYPLGWDKVEKNRVIFYALAHTNDKPLFLGTWSIDIEGKYPRLVSETSTSSNIELNGFGLEEIK